MRSQSNRCRRLRHARRGFSLLEIMLVLAIIGVLMGVAAVNLLGQSERAQVRATEQTLYVVNNAVKQYAIDNRNAFPEGLELLISERLLEPGSLEDAWGEPLFYSPKSDSNANPFVLVSAGPDRELGTEDDINYWDIADRRR
ncbi:MAG: prepilin-type N-terminal cleavage/methylation domain-containing protein [Phycisphaerales bacterium]|nr:MAG: prepilin-type N-terminal cleavage/methylation domain-containing protein [Phycisphaerales bacterium]